MRGKILGYNSVHAKFLYYQKLYAANLELVEEAGNRDLHVTYHRECDLRYFLVFLDDTFVFMDKSATYVDVTYLKYFINLTTIHEWNLRTTCLLYMYFKLSKG